MRQWFESKAVRKWAKVLLPLVALAVAVTWSVLAHQPATLPGASLGWRPLFDLERAAAGLGIIGTVWLVGWRGLHGHFPLKFANLEYADQAQAATDLGANHEQRIALIEALLDLADEEPK